MKGKIKAFESRQARDVFWEKFNQYTQEFGFVPWVTSLIPNHYHTVGYLREGKNLGPMMQRVHGSVAKMVNDLRGEKVKPFWRDESGQEYFDGCLRDEKQCWRAYRYTLLQGVRHGLARDWREYPDTRVGVECERAIRRAVELGALMWGVRYKRYER